MRVSISAGRSDIRTADRLFASGIASADQELKVWQKLLTKHYNGLISVLDTPLKKQKLQASQALWSKLRDADRRLAHTVFDGGTMAIPMMGHCTMQTTARRALMLRQ
jgi:uncharacterized protein YecT (DUF1311 family)